MYSFFLKTDKFYIWIITHSPFTSRKSGQNNSKLSDTKHNYNRHVCIKQQNHDLTFQLWPIKYELMRTENKDCKNTF